LSYVSGEPSIVSNGTVIECASSNPRRPNFTQRCKRFATASTFTQVAALPCRYDAEMGTANLLHASA